MFYGINNIPQNILIFKLNVGIFHRILSIPWNIVMDPNNIMDLPQEAFILAFTFKWFTLWTMKSDHGRWPLSMVQVMVRLPWSNFIKI